MPMSRLNTVPAIFKVLLSWFDILTFQVYILSNTHSLWR